MRKGARVIISASGMMTGGRVLHHALRLVPDPDATIVFVGYQAAGTTGRRILDGEPEVKILGQWVPVRCRVAKIGGFSAHADWKEVLTLAGRNGERRAQPDFPDARRTGSGERDGRVTSKRSLVGTYTCRSMVSGLSWCKTQLAKDLFCVTLWFYALDTETH